MPKRVKTVCNQIDILTIFFLFPRAPWIRTEHYSLLRDIYDHSQLATAPQDLLLIVLYIEELWNFPNIHLHPVVRVNFNFYLSITLTGRCAPHSENQILSLQGYCSKMKKDLDLINFNRTIEFSKIKIGFTPLLDKLVALLRVRFDF